MDPVDPRKQDGVVYKIPCECGKVYIGATARFAWTHESCTIGIYGFHKLKLRPFLNTPIRPGIIRSGTKLRWLPETLTGTLVEAIHIWLHPNNINRVEIEIPEAWMPTIRQSDMTTNLYHSRPMRDQFLPLTMPTILWIEAHRPWARSVIHQSLTTTVVNWHYRLMKTYSVRS